MILVLFFFFFSGIFFYIYQDNILLHEDYQEIIIDDLMQSIATYARLHGRLPNTKKYKTPWEIIGISQNFFIHYKNFQNLEYLPTLEYTSSYLISVDCFHWIASQMLYSEAHFLHTANKKEIHDAINGKYEIDSNMFQLYLGNASFYPIYIPKSKSQHYRIQTSRMNITMIDKPEAFILKSKFFNISESKESLIAKMHFNTKYFNCDYKTKIKYRCKRSKKKDEDIRQVETNYIAYPYPEYLILGYIL